MNFGAFRQLFCDDDVKSIAITKGIIYIDSKNEGDLDFGKKLMDNIFDDENSSSGEDSDDSREEDREDDIPLNAQDKVKKVLGDDFKVKAATIDIVLITDSEDSEKSGQLFQFLMMMSFLKLSKKAEVTFSKSEEVAEELEEILCPKEESKGSQSKPKFNIIKPQVIEEKRDYMEQKVIKVFEEDEIHISEFIEEKVTPKPAEVKFKFNDATYSSKEYIPDPSYEVIKNADIEEAAAEVFEKAQEVDKNFDTKELAVKLDEKREENAKKQKEEEMKNPPKKKIKKKKKKRAKKRRNLCKGCCELIAKKLGPNLSFENNSCTCKILTGKIVYLLEESNVNIDDLMNTNPSSSSSDKTERERLEKENAELRKLLKLKEQNLGERKPQDDSSEDIIGRDDPRAYSQGLQEVDVQENSKEEIESQSDHPKSETFSNNIDKVLSSKPPGSRFAGSEYVEEKASLGSVQKSKDSQSSSSNAMTFSYDYREEVKEAIGDSAPNKGSSEVHLGQQVVSANGEDEVMEQLDPGPGSGSHIPPGSEPPAQNEEAKSEQEQEDGERSGTDPAGTSNSDATLLIDEESGEGE